MIRSSLRGKYGPGVYLTDLNPDENDKELIAGELYQGGASRNLNSLDHHIQLEIPEKRVIKAPNRKHVYRYAGMSGLMLSEYDVVSKGDNDSWQQTSLVVAGSGLVLATVGVQVAQALFHNATEGRQIRSRALFDTLVRLLMNDDLLEMFSVNQSDDGGSVRVYCKDCSKPVSDEYSGGFIFGSCIDENALLRTLKEHRQSHQGLFASLLLVGVAVVDFLVAIFVFSIQQLKWW